MSDDTFVVVKHDNAIVPGWILYNQDLEHSDIRLWAIFAASDSSTELSYSKIASFFKCSNRTILRSISRLEKVNALVVTRTKGKKNSYHLWPYLFETSDTGVTTTGDTGVTSDTGVTTLSDENSGTLYSLNNECTFTKSTDNFSEKVEGRKYGKNEYPDSFNALWKLYPRKTNKPGAYKCYLTKLKEGATEEQLMAAVVAYAASREGQDQTFTMHGSTFFGPNDRWQDFAGVGVKDPATDEYDATCAEIYDQWDADGMWIDPDSHEEVFQNPVMHGYNRPRNAENYFVASDGTPYDLNSSGERVAPGYWGSR